MRAREGNREAGCVRWFARRRISVRWNRKLGVGFEGMGNHRSGNRWRAVCDPTLILFISTARGAKQRDTTTSRSHQRPERNRGAEVEAAFEEVYRTS